MKRTGFIIAGIVGLGLAAGLWRRSDALKPDLASLEKAASAGHRKLVELYLFLGAATNATPENMREAVREGEIEKVRNFLARDSSLASAAMDNGCTPLYIAVSDGNLDLVHMLVEHGADAQDISNIRVAVSFGHVEVVKFLLDQAGEAIRKKLDASLLTNAVESGRKEMLALLLAEGIPVQATDQKGYGEVGPLFEAIMRRDQEMVKMLLAAGAEPTVFEEAGLGRLEAVGQRLDTNPDLIRACNEQGMTLLAVAAMMGDLRLARYLLDRGAEVDRTALDCDFPSGAFYCSTPFLFAVGNLDMMKLLLSRGASIYTEAYEDGNASCLTEDFATLKFLLESGMKVENHKDPDDMRAGNCMSLRYAGKDLRFAKLLKEYGADVHARGLRGTTPLHWVCRPEVAEWLIQEGAEVNAEDQGGGTPLWNIASTPFEDKGCDYVGVLKMLLAHGAKLQNHEGLSTLHATYHPQVVRLLVAHGADINARDERGDTPLHAAVKDKICGQWDCKDLVKAMLESGADVNARDRQGRTPLWYAMLWRWKRPQMVDLLRSYGAKE